MNYIHVFNGDRDMNQPLFSLLNDEGIRQFFMWACEIPLESYFRLFPDGEIALISFNTMCPCFTGTGTYVLRGGKVKVLSETGHLLGTLSRVGFERVVPY